MEDTTTLASCGEADVDGRKFSIGDTGTVMEAEVQVVEGVKDGTEVDKTRQGAGAEGAPTAAVIHDLCPPPKNIAEVELTEATSRALAVRFFGAMAISVAW